MKRVLDFIEQQKRGIDEAPFHVFLRDQSIPAQQRLSFAPCMAPFVMGFADINKYVLREESSEDPLQRIINTHTEEDDHHFGMFLKDLQTLDLNDSLPFTDALTLLWGNETKRTRQLIYGLTKMTATANPLMRLVIVEAIESAGNHGFQRFLEVARQFYEQTGKRLYYFGDMHMGLESGHAMGTENVESKLASIQLTSDQEQEALALVERVFKLFYALSEDLLEYVRQRSRRDAGRQGTVRAGAE